MEQVQKQSLVNVKQINLYFLDHCNSKSAKSSYKQHNHQKYTRIDIYQQNKLGLTSSKLALITHFPPLQSQIHPISTLVLNILLKLIFITISRTNNKQMIESNKNWKFRYGIMYIYTFVLLGNIISVLGPLIPLKAREGHKHQTDFSVVFTFRGVGYVTGSIIVAQLEKKYGAHQMMSITSIFCAILCFLNTSETSVLSNIIEWFLIGLTCSFLEVLSQVSIVVIFKEEVNAWMQALHFGFGVGAFISPFMIALIGNKTMTFIGILALINAILIYREVSPKGQKQQKISQSNTSIAVNNLQQPPKNLIKLLCIYFFILVGAESAFSGWIPSFCTITGATDQKQAGVSSSLFWIAMTVGRLIAIPISSRFHGASQLRFLSYACLVVLTLCMLTMISGALKTTVYVGSIMFGLSASAIYPLLITTPVSFGYFLSPTNTATFAVVGSLGQAMLPVFIGIMMQMFGPFILFISIFLITVVMVSLYHIIMTYKTEQSASQSSLQMKLLAH